MLGTMLIKAKIDSYGRGILVKAAKKELLKIEELKKSYKKGNEINVVIDKLNLSIYQEEIVCVFGRSGSGKTTLLNIIGTLDKPDSGKILLEGENPFLLSSSYLPAFRRKNIGFVFQYFNLVPYMSALENTAIPLKYEGIPKKKREKRAEELLTRLGLKDRLNYKPGELSGGQIQRTAFARAVINKPKIVLADEPTGQLDLKTAKELADLILQINKEERTTFIIATHDPVFDDIAHRTIFLEGGSFQTSTSNA